MLSLPELGVYFSLVLFLLGFCCVMFRRNIIFMLLGMELILNGANLALVSASRLTGTVDGQVTMFFVMAVAACEAAVGLALLIALYRSRGSVEADDLKLLRG